MVRSGGDGADSRPCRLPRATYARQVREDIEKALESTTERFGPQVTACERLRELHRVADLSL